jgi:hypothetical protein
MAVHETHCPQCGHAAAPPSAADTDLLNRPPVTLPDEHEASAVFSPEAAAILQFLPSGLCLSLWLEQPLILGRGPLPEPEERIDLSDMGGVQHGVSRCHCLLQRRDHHLMVTDLGSTNGTYLNGELLLPHQSHILRHGDRLILGTLHLLISFSTVETDQGPAQF